MAIFSKKSKTDDQKSSEKENLLNMVPADAEKAAKGEKSEKTEQKTAPSKTDTGDAFRILVKPIVSEKAYRGAQNGKFVFRVSRNANKISIKKAVERVYDVHVADVNIVNVSGKRRNFGRISGRTQDWKKAIVTLRKGETIAESN